MTVFSRDEFMELARPGNNLWAVPKAFAVACRENRTDEEAQKSLIGAVLKMLPEMRGNMGAHNTLLGDSARFSMDNFEQAVTGGRESSAYFWISAVQKIAIQNARYNERYRQHILDKFKKIHEAMPQLAQHIRAHELLVMFNDNEAAQNAMFKQTRDIMFPPQEQPGRPAPVARGVSVTPEAA